MPRRPRVETVSEPNFERDARALVRKDEGRELLFEFAIQFATLLDSIISNTDTWMSIGMRRNSGQLLVTMRDGSTKSYAGGQELIGFLEEFMAL